MLIGSSLCWLDKERHPTKYGDLSDYAIANLTCKHKFNPLPITCWDMLCNQIIHSYAEKMRQ